MYMQNYTPINKIPSQEAMQMLALKEFETRKIARACANCWKWEKANTRCSVSKKTMPAYMTCLSHEFDTEHIANVAIDSLKKQQAESDKFENLLALAITTANTTTCFLEDLETRIKKIYKNECNKENRKLLRKDMGMTDDMKKAFADIQDFLDKIERRYRFYVQPYIMKWFTKEGKFNEEQSDAHLNNAMEFGRLLMMFTMKCIGNKENCDAVFNLLASMENDNDYALNENDAAHYKLKGYDD
jgi:hypothetical protein